MQVVILSGGSGLRLWPLSNSVHSKQFLKLFPTEDGAYESMLARSYRMVKDALPGVPITITSSAAQKSTTIAELGEVDVCVEPSRRETFAAICLAASYLHDVKAVPEDETLVVCSSDGNTTSDFFELFAKIDELFSKEKNTNLCCIGVEASYPSEKYGYIVPEARADVARVSHFVEKPSASAANELISKGALWNAGTYGMRLGYALKLAQEHLGMSNYEDLLSHYDEIRSTSFDYVVAEHEKNFSVVRYTGTWSDLGTWATLADALTSGKRGKVVLDEASTHTLAINELGIPLLVLGIDNAIACATADGILLASKSATSHMKPFVEQLDNEPRRSQKSWGSYEVINVQEKSMTMLVTLNAGHHMNYHAHEHRDESWTVLSGEGIAICDGVETRMSAGDTISVPRGVFHSLYATSELKVIEVQVGTEIDVRDKRIQDWDFSQYGRP